ncbi:hypothetical protein [Stutzerimonas kunmingensis]|uniref:hypothetical protein n=2 Tax=Stutzerimonas stutzeri group TaxID=136846 RepID=UPI0028ABBA9F|nr:hypothetical protein [Stutzerimonas kunmingensis]
MIQEHHKRDDVFGLSRDIPLNYVTREYADKKFLTNLRSQKHVVLYGGSKQGKTCLRKHCLAPDQYILVQCVNGLDSAGLNASILKRAGFEITQSQTKTAAGKNKVTAAFKAKLLDIGIELGGEKGTETQVSVVTAPLELDL